MAVLGGLLFRSQPGMALVCGSPVRVCGHTTPFSKPQASFNDSSPAALGTGRHSPPTLSTCGRPPSGSTIIRPYLQAGVRGCTRMGWVTALLATSCRPTFWGAQQSLAAPELMHALQACPWLHPGWIAQQASGWRQLRSHAIGHVRGQRRGGAVVEECAWLQHFEGGGLRREGGRWGGTQVTGKRVHP